MANPTVPKKSNVAGRVPKPKDLLIGEIATNIRDGVFYIRMFDGSVKPVAGISYVSPHASNHVLGGSDPIYISSGQVTDFISAVVNNAPVKSVAGKTGIVLLNVQDVSEAQKVITSGTAEPSGGVDGDIYLQYTA